MLWSGNGWWGSVCLPQCTQQMQCAQQQAHKDKMDSDVFWVKHPAFCKMRCYQVGRDISAVTASVVSHLVAAVLSGGMDPGTGHRCSLERARLGHHLLAGWAEVLGAAPVQGEAGGAGVVAVAQDGGFPAAEAPSGSLSLQPGPGAAPAGQAACCVLEQMPAEEHVNPGVAAAAEAGQQHGDGERHVGGLWEGKGRELKHPPGWAWSGQGPRVQWAGPRGLFLAQACVLCPIPIPSDQHFFRFVAWQAELGSTLG